MTDPSQLDALPPPTAGATPPPDDADQIRVPYQGRPPRAGELTTGWRIITVITWIAVVLSLATVWNVSVQLGLSTWWLGPRSQPQPRIVQLSPFVAPVLLILATINQARWLAWWGLAAAAVIAGIGIVDMWSVASIAAVELLIAALAAAVSIASLTGTYRQGPAVDEPPAD